MADITFLAGENMQEVQRGDPRGVTPRFFTKVCKKDDGTFYEREMVELLIHGDQKTAPVSIVTDRHRRMYPKQYEAFKSGKEASVDGTPLALMFGERSAIVMDMQRANVFTIEQLADLEDTQARHLGIDGVHWRNKARAWVEAQKKGGPSEALVSENKQLKQQMETQARAFEEMKERMAELEAQSQKPKNKGGRPRKVSPAEHPNEAA